MRLQGMSPGIVLRLGPPAEGALCEPACNQPIAKTVVAKDAYRGAPTISKYVQPAVERFRLQLPPAECRQPIDAIAEIDGLVSEKNSLLRN